MTSVRTAVQDLKVGDVIKSFVDLIPNLTVTRAPQLGWGEMYDFDTDHAGTLRARKDFSYVVITKGGEGSCFEG